MLNIIIFDLFINKYSIVEFAFVLLSVYYYKMTVLSILQYPHPLLSQPTKLVTDFGEETQKIIDDMFETHYAQENCAALAANQLGIPLRITVIDFSEEKNSPLCLVNAKIIKQSGLNITKEGCMSLLNAGFHKVKRASEVTVTYQDRYGEEKVLEADGFMAKCIQHELDHLDGKVYLDHLGQLKRKMIERKLLEIRKKNKK
ncbi:MAG: peptide deformylase [Pseudomonadota bacterium]|nr:peptide deformylase [Pseudomonadota bacterium]